MSDLHSTNPERFCLCCGSFVRGDYFVLALDVLGFVDAVPQRGKQASPEEIAYARGVLGDLDCRSLLAYVCWSCRTGFENRTSMRGPEIAPPRVIP